MEKETFNHSLLRASVKKTKQKVSILTAVREVVKVPEWKDFSLVIVCDFDFCVGALRTKYRRVYGRLNNTVPFL